MKRGQTQYSLLWRAPSVTDFPLALLDGKAADWMERVGDEQ
jgi:hypothetical protein